MIDSVEQWEENSNKYYRLEPATRGQQLADGLDFLANRHEFKDQHTRDMHLYLFARAAQEEPELVARYRALLDGSSSQGRLFISTILSLLGRGDVTNLAEQLGPTFPAGLDALSRPIRIPGDLDYLWVEFFLAGREEPVRKIIEVIAWPDRIRRRLETWLRTPVSGPRERWNRRRSAKRLRKHFGIVCNLEMRRIDTLGDLDARCTVDAEEHFRQRGVSAARETPAVLSDDDALYVATKGAARWSLASIVNTDPTVAQIYERMLPGLREGTELGSLTVTGRPMALGAPHDSRDEGRADDGGSAFERGDFETALKEQLPRAEQGDAAAQHDVGLLYATGLGREPDFAKAFEWWHKAADQGLAEAEYHMGNLYSNGWGTTQDNGKAVDWFRRAAQQGHSGAQYNLGGHYFRGLGVPQDVDQANRLFGLAAISYQERVDEGFDTMRKCPPSAPGHIIRQPQPPCPSALAPVSALTKSLP